jgi:NitT/TauT family transport system ATP-binding protein
MTMTVPLAGPSIGDVVARANGLSKEFHQRGRPILALDSVDLAIRPGEFVAIVGASGCGKTTLLNIIAGLTAPTGGTLERAPAVARQGGIGMVFQNPVLLPWRNVLDNVIAPAEILGMEMGESRRRAGALLIKVGLAGFEGALPYQLSGGMQQRVSICRALLSDPPLLLMDEPFGALDALTRERMNLELQRIWIEGNKTVVLVTHSIEEAVFLSDRIVAMTPRPGRIAQVIVNELPRPRTVETYEDPLFIEYAAQIRKIILNAEGPIQPRPGALDGPASLQEG